MNIIDLEYSKPDGYNKTPIQSACYSQEDIDKLNENYSLIEQFMFQHFKPSLRYLYEKGTTFHYIWYRNIWKN